LRNALVAKTSMRAQIDAPIQHLNHTRLSRSLERKRLARRPCLRMIVAIGRIAVVLVKHLHAALPVVAEVLNKHPSRHEQSPLLGTILEGGAGNASRIEARSPTILIFLNRDFFRSPTLAMSATAIQHLWHFQRTTKDQNIAGPVVYHRTTESRRAEVMRHLPLRVIHFEQFPDRNGCTSRHRFKTVHYPIHKH